jgi:hypothetical protein
MVTARTQQLINQFESLSLESVDQLTNLYATHALFKDPFNQVIGRDAIKQIFVHMFSQVNNPRFLINSVLEDDQHASLTWDFRFEFKSSPQHSEIIRGCTWFTFNDHDLITEHRDYWDAAEELYEKLPLIGSLMKWLKKRAKHSA